MSSTMVPTKPTIGVIWRNGIMAAVIAAVVNGILFLIGSAAGAFPSSVITPMGVPITIGAVVLMSAVGVLVGTLVYTIFSRFSARSGRWFTIVAVIVLLLMAYSPFSLAGAPTLMILFLEIMHLVAGGAAIYFLTRA
ncbi:MAG: DUF6069 family protein [Chloroflexi bacterium]|nr:DUF6069 family protein [Chloroflexota bacterium]